MTFLITIDSINYKIRSKVTILQACELNNILIPKFCYHKRLSVAGNCRMCLVEVIKMPKLQVSCAVLLVDKMVIYTKSPLVLKAREGVLEFLLINHPLDCPICDQGGECDLQDQSLFYGNDKNRFKEFKRAVEDKYCGPLVKTIMTRCIHCTRCVRFINEITGVPSLGTSGRGNSIKISFYVRRLFSSELSGNVIDLCPVGALTSKSYAFLSRPWELKSVESIDIFDSIHSNIKINVKGNDIVRVVPCINEFVNKEWISDKIRFGLDGLLFQRLSTPLIKNIRGRFDVTTWSDAYYEIYLRLFSLKKIKKVGLFVGPFCDFESLVCIKKLTHLLNINVLNHADNFWLDSDFDNSFKFNIFLNGIVNSDFCLILGINPKTEGPILNFHLRKRFLQGRFKVAYFGSYSNLSFPYYHTGCSINSFLSFLEGNNSLCHQFRKSRRPLIIIGRAFLERINGLGFSIFSNNLFKLHNRLDPFWNVFSFFNSNSKDFCFYDLCLDHNYSLTKKSQFDLIFIVEDFRPVSIFSHSRFTVFLGHHGCSNAQKSDLILPTTSFVEKTAKFGSCEGRYQYSRFALPPLKYSQDSSTFLSNLVSDCLYSSYESDYINTFSYYLDYLFPSFYSHLNQVYISFFVVSYFSHNLVTLDSFYVLSGFSDNFYKTDVISKHSLVMSRSSEELLEKVPFKL